MRAWPTELTGQLREDVGAAGTPRAQAMSETTAKAPAGLDSTFPEFEVRNQPRRRS